MAFLRSKNYIKNNKVFDIEVKTIENYTFFLYKFVKENLITEVEYNFTYVEIKVTSEDIKNGRAKSLENVLEIVRSIINEKCNTD